MGLPAGRYVAKLHGWEVEPASARRRARVDVTRDGEPFQTMIFGLNGGAMVRIRRLANTTPDERPEDRAVQAVTMVVQDRIRGLLSHGEDLPAETEITEDEIVAATQYVKVDQDLDGPKGDPDDLLWEEQVP